VNTSTVGIVLLFVLFVFLLVIGVRTRCKPPPDGETVIRSRLYLSGEALTTLNAQLQLMLPFITEGLSNREISRRTGLQLAIVRHHQTYYWTKQ
jgi:hypothetical protein